jgi:2-dehydro-3-deoxy-D-arabinonate dehydratase
MTIRRHDTDIFGGAVELRAMRRSIDELGAWLFRARSFPHGVILLTGTGIVPDDDFTSLPGDEIAISISGLGTLHNTVQRVGVEHGGSDPRRLQPGDLANAPSKGSAH